MNYPSINEYKEALLFTEDNFEQLKNLRPVLDDEGNPVMTGGNFAEVFKMKDEQTGKLYAVKCFLREQEGRAEAYRQIAEELEFVSSTFLTPIKYLDKELFVDSSNSEDSEFPVLLMDWVEGQTLDKYIREHIDDQYELSLLAYQFSRLAMWLMPQPFAHGDLKPDNILVKEDGTLVLVDYDGMYVPAMKGQRARELGSPDFRHPGRTEEVFDDHIDDFSLASILLSLKAIALQPDLLGKYGTSDRLLFSEKDYRNLSESSAIGALQPLMQDAELASLYSLYILALSQNNLSQVSFRLFNLKRPKMTKKDIGLRANRNNKKETIENEYVDLGLSVKWATCNIGARKPEEFGDYFQWGNIIPKNGPSSNKSKTGLSFNSKYNSSSGKTILESCDDTATCLLGSPWRMPSKKEITELINSCEWKEEYLNGVKGCRVIGPNGNSIFLPIAGGYSWGRPYSTGKGVYWSSTAYTQQDLVFNNSWFLYFKNSKPSISYYDRSCAYSIRPVLIEDENLSTEVTDEDLANAWTDEYGVKYSQDKRRLLACNLGELLWNEWSWEYTIRKETKVICDNAFAFSKSSYHNGETFVTLPDGLISIGNFAFMGLSLKSIIIPKSTTAIANDAFVNTVHLSSIVVDKRNHVFDSRNNCNAIIKTKSNTLVVGCASTIIPSNIIKIGSNAFYGCINLKSISLPNSVVSIEDFAFYGCEGLKQFSLPNDIKSIGESAFDFNYLFLPDSILHIGNGYSNCRLKRFYANKETQKRILDIHPEYSCLFDDSVSTKYDFNNALEDEFGAKYSSDKRCLLSVPIGLKEYMIKEGTEIICNYAFVGGSYNDLKKMALIHKKVNAESIVLPNSINSIGKYALSGCNNLQSIVIPIGTKEKFEELLPDYKDKFVEQVDEENLSTEVTEEDLANAWIDEFGVKYSADKKRLLMAPKEIAKYTIIEGTTIICNSAFERCSLTSVTIPNSIKVIGKNAFQGCFDLAAIELPDDLLIIADYAFDMCHSVKSIVLPSSVKFMGCGAFCDMRGLSSLKVDEKNQNFDSRNHCDAIIRTKDNVLIRGCSNTVIPSTVSCIGDSAFSGCDTLCSITIPNSIKSIGKYAFENCELLCSIEIPDSIVTIEDYAFDNCYSLKTISLPSSISKIGYMPFNECGVLSQIVIPKGTKHKFEKLLLKYKDKIVEQGGDENLSTEVTDEDLVNAWTDEYGVKYSADRKRLLKAPTEIRRYSVRNGTKIICNKAFQSTLLAQVIIPNSVLCIGDDAFGGCCLTSIEIPENVQSIGERAFSYNALNSVTIPQNVKHIGKGAFGSCGSLICIIVNKENKFYDSRNDCNAIIETKSNTLIVGCQNTIIPNNVKSVGEWAFTGCCNLSFIFIPKEVLMIGQRAFNGCERLKKISVDKDNEFFDSRNDCNAIIETKTNTLIVGCKNTIIPNSVKTIGEWAFSGCNKLSAINIPESVLSINEGAFSGCSDLSNVELPKGLKELGCRVFSDSGIESIIIPDGIEVISESLFNCCRNLISVNLPNSVTTIENYAFSQCRPLSSISMSDNVITIGDWAFACCSSLASIELSNSIQIIGKGAFYDCESLRTFFIPLGLKTKFEVLLPAYKDKLVER